MPDVDVHNHDDLVKSLEHWKHQLAQRNTNLSQARKATESAHKAKQLVQARIERRQRQIASLHPHKDRQAYLKLALTQVGVTEHPPGSNQGAQVSAYQQPFGIDGQPWCGAFQGWLARHQKIGVTSRIVYTPYIYEDAAKGVNGLREVVWHDHFMHTHRQANIADLVLFDFGTGGIEHVGMLAKPWTGGLLQTIEGNTSFGGGGSQDNGGAVARRQRDPSLVHSIVSLNWL